MKISLVLLYLFLIPVYSVSSETYKDYLKQGDQYYSEFNNHSALKSYLMAYKLSPDNYEVIFRLARTYNDLGEEFYEYRERDSSEVMIKKALEYSEMLGKDFPDSAASYAYLALSYGNRALFEGGKEKIKLAHKIEDNAKKSLQMNPDQYLSYIILGIYYRQIADLSWIERIFANTFFGNVPEGTFNESIEMLNKALQVKPNTIVATFQLSRTYKSMGDKDDEIILLKKLLTYPQKNFRDKFAIKKAERRLKELE
jgi:Regulator of microtubule dynamics protein 1-3